MKISVVTPSYRQLRWLSSCVASVHDQVGDGTLPAVSVEHLVEDAGTDGLAEWCRGRGVALALDDRPYASPGGAYALVVHRAPDRGMYDAINRGLRRATGDVCAYLNCDEQYLPGVLPRVARWFRDNPSTDVLFCDAVVVDAEGRYVADRRATLPKLWHTLVSGNLAVLTCSTFFRRALVRERGFEFDPTWRALGDAEWIGRLLRAGVSMDTLRLRASIHTDTGENLVLTPIAGVEARRLAATAPWWARRARALTVLEHRLRRFQAGAYSIAPHRYAIFTQSSPDVRVAFDVARPTYRWRS